VIVAAPGRNARASVPPSLAAVRKTVFVHIGAPAAGGSFLQRQLEESRAPLRDAGVGVLDSLRPGLRGGGLVVDCRTVVVSSPRLAGAPAHRVARVLGTLADEHVQLIYGLPDIGDALVAEWQRHVLATARTVALAAWIKELASGEHPSFWRTYDLAEVFRRWSISPGDVHVLVAGSDAGGADDLWKRFSSVIGAPALGAGRIVPVEEPPELEELELLRRIHARARERGVRGADRVDRQATVVREVWPRRDPGPWPLPQEHRSWIENEAARQRAFLVSSGFAIVGDLVDLELDDRRFAVDAALPDEPRLLECGVDVSAALVERLIRGRERRAPTEIREIAADESAAGAISRIVARARGLVSTISAEAPGVVRRRFRPVGRPIYYLHIGAPKSGSSYLQSLLWKNRGALMRDGVYVPGRSQADHFWAGTDFRGRSYVTQAPSDSWRGAWDRLIDDTERAGYPKVVISSEFLAESGAEEISTRLERLSEAEVHVIYAVRDLAGLLGSVWQQGLQIGPAAPWYEWLDAQARSGGPGMWSRHDVGTICERWTAGGADEIAVLVVPRSGSARDELWRRFQSIVGWSVRTRVEGHRANESLGYSQAEFLRRLQHRLVDVKPRHQRARLTKNLIANQILRRMDRIDATVIPEHLRAWLETESAKRRDQLIESRARIVGDVDDLLVVDSRLSPDPPDPCEAVMVDAAVHVIDRLAATVLRTEARSDARPRLPSAPAGS
jgi:hypothetical protein